MHPSLAHRQLANKKIFNPPGCGYNPYRLGHKDYYGPGLKVDTSRPFTVVTQFPADAAGNLKEIHRIYVQDGKMIQNAKVLDAGLPQVSYTTDEYCKATGARRFMELGAHKTMGDALTRGMVLAFSIWWDESGGMTWLDGEKDGAGPCKDGEGLPAAVRKVEADPTVVFSNIKWGEIGSTFKPECKSAKLRKH
jgi:cellulase